MVSYLKNIIDIQNLTHNVRRIRIERPGGYDFIPGQATEISLPGHEDDTRPFTFTGLTDWDFLEFSIKIYPEHQGVTNEIGKLKTGDKLIIHDVWGAIQYRGKGVFAAGGAGVTPFIAILRDLFRKNELSGNRLFFSNKTEADIILRDEFEKMLGNDFYNTLTFEKSSCCRFGKFDEEFFREKINNFKQPFYVCGPDGYVADLNSIFTKLGADPEMLVFEK